MKTTIRYQDANKPWLPKPALTKVIPKPSCLEGFRLPRDSRAEPVDQTPRDSYREFVDGWKRRTASNGKPHPWAERRKDVIEKFDENVIKTVTPIGYEDVWDPEMRFASPKDEWDYIYATSSNELAPDWLTLRTNGVRGESLDALKESEDGDYTLADLASSDNKQYIPMADWEHAFELLGGMRRVEAFLKAEDEQKWFTGRVRRYAWAVNEHGKRGLIRLTRSISDKQFAKDWERAKQDIPPQEYIERAQEHREANTEMVMTDRGTARRQYKPGTFSSREDMRARALYKALDRIEDERIEVDTLGEAVEEGYLPNTPCPNESCSERGEDCVVCYGEGYILHTLGVDGEMDSTYGTWREEKRARPRHSRSLRASLKRLDKDVADIEAHERKHKRALVGRASDKSLDSLPF